MKVPLLDLKAQLKPMREDILSAVTEVIDSTRYIGGPKLEELESAVASYSGMNYGIGVSSGSDALLVSLMALDIKSGDRVVTTPFSFFATAGAVVRLGARPVFIDIDPETYNISPALLNEFLGREKNSGDLKAAIPVHLFGQMADMDPIVEACQKRGIAIIEDAAQAIGAQYPSKQGAKSAGAMGDTGCFSFFPSKNLGCAGDGGMVVAGDKDLADRVRLLRNHGAKPKYYHSLVGGNFRLDPLQAAILLVKFSYLDEWSAKRSRNADRYDALFAESGLVGDNLIGTPSRAWAGKGLDNPHIFNQYVIRVKDGQRDALRAHLETAGVGAEVYYPVPFHEQLCFKDLGYRSGDFPAAESAAKEVLALPVYPELTAEMQEFVVERVAGFYKR